MAMAAMPTSVTVRISRSDLYQSIFVLQVMLLVLSIALLHRLQEDLAQTYGRDIDVDCAAFAAQLGDSISVAASQNDDLAAVAAYLLDAEDGLESWRWSSEAKGDAAIVLANLLERHIEDSGAAVNHEDVISDSFDL